MIEMLSQLAVVLGPLFPFVGATGAIGVASLAQVFPRVGPLRALWIAGRSRFLESKPVVLSARATELSLLRKTIDCKNWGQNYIVVAGEKGVGKSCFIDTALYKTCGVIRVEAHPGHTGDTIIENSLKGLTGLRTTRWDPISNSRRVLFWYKMITFGSTPIIVISVTERTKEDKYAGVSAAVRTLTDKLHLRVIVDSSPNSLVENVIRTNREDVYYIDSMSREMLESLPQFSLLFTVTKRNQVDDILWGVFGGNPAKYGKFWNQLEKRLDKEPDLVLERKIIGKLLCDEISAAIDLVTTEQMAFPDLKNILELFDKEKGQLVVHLLNSKGLQRPAPDKVFRKIERNDVYVLIPSCNAVGIVLRHGITKRPSLEELKILI